MRESIRERRSYEPNELSTYQALEGTPSEEAIDTWYLKSLLAHMLLFKLHIYIHKLRFFIIIVYFLTFL